MMFSSSEPGCLLHQHIEGDLGAQGAAMRRQKGGKLPIGEVDALVYETKYKGIKMTNIFANIVSNGALAEGFLKAEGKLKLADILCSFSFIDTNEMKKMKIKPSLRFHLFHRNKDHNKVAKL